MATVYAVASAKGGVGKTTTTAAMATILAGSGADVVAIDADIGMANLAGVLGVSPGETTLHDVLAGRAEALDAVHEGPEGLRVVPGADDLDAYASADPAGLSEAVAAFDDADYVLLDAGAGLSHDSSLPLAIADETLLVSTAERSALGDTEKTRQLAERLGGTVAGAAITRVDPDADPDEVGAEGLDDIGDVLDAPVLGRIPEDDAVVRAASANRPLPTFAPDAPATRAYRDLTRALTGAAIDGAGLDDTGESDDEAGGDERDEDDEGEAEAEEVEGDEGGDGADERDVETDAADDDADEAVETDAADDADDEVNEVNVADEEIVIADAETAVSEEAVETTASDHEADDVETETVGGERVDGDDLEEMIEENVDEAEAFEGTDATESDDGDPASTDESATPEDEAAADETASDPDDEPEDDAAADEPASDPDDELAGSVPFRDDDTGTMNTVLSESDEDDGSDDAESETTADAEADDEGEEEEEEKQSRGFFSRLFGR